MAISRGDHLDVIEIDGASNNGVDEVRELRAKVSLAPFSALYKVYIIDEVHMLSMAAFNALLKTIEEPPEHVIFILATTEPHKVPVTIRSRCQHIPFHRISVSHIRQRLRHVCKQEGFQIQEEALWELSRQADGALRDALSLLEQVAILSSGDLTMEGICLMLGGGTRPEVERWVTLLREGPEEAHSQLQAMVDSGISPERFLDQVFLVFRDLWVVRKWGESVVSGLDLSEQEKSFLLEEAPRWPERTLSQAMDYCLRLFGRVRLGVRGDVFVGALTAGLLAGKPEPHSSEREMDVQKRIPEAPTSKAGAHVPAVHQSDYVRPVPGRVEPQRAPASAPKRVVSPTAPVPAPGKEPPASEAAMGDKGDPTQLSGPHTNFTEDPKRAWMALMLDLAAQDLALFAALSRCKVVIDPGVLLKIVIPDGFPFLGDLISQERHSWRISRFCESRGFDKPIHLVAGEMEMPLSAPPEGELDDVLTANAGTLFQVPASVIGSEGSNKSSSVSPQGEDVPRFSPAETGVEKDVDRLRRWFSAEVLLLKKDSANEEEPRPEEAAEEGATEI
jgi:DNA polymerase-3 subunit gamma/tau